MRPLPFTVGAPVAVAVLDGTELRRTPPGCRVSLVPLGDETLVRARMVFEADALLEAAVGLGRAADLVSTHGMGISNRSAKRSFLYSTVRRAPAEHKSQRSLAISVLHAMIEKAPTKVRRALRVTFAHRSVRPRLARQCKTYCPMQCKE